MYIFKDGLKAINDSINKNGNIMLIAMATIPFFVAFLIIYSFTNGNINLTSYIIQEIGAAQIFSTGIIFAIVNFLELLLTFFIIGIVAARRKFEEIHNLELAIFILACFLSLLLFPVIFNTLLLLSVVYILIIKKIKNQKKKDNPVVDTPREVIIIWLINLIVATMLSYPLTTSTLITMKDNNTVQAAILSKKDKYYFVLNKDHKLTFVYTDQIKNEKPCSNNTNSLLLETPINLISHFKKGALIDNCK